jgi:hypothetical protein
VEAVGVLHDEFAAAHEAEARADLVAELRLDLVERGGQLLVGAQLVAHQARDELFVRGAQAQAVAVAVLDAHELGAVVVPTAGLMPDLRVLQNGHHHFLGADAVHLVADDGLDLLDHALAQGKIRVEPRVAHLRIMPARSSSL